MRACLDTQTKPSVPLLDRHVRFLNGTLEKRFQSTHNTQLWRELALAGFLNLILWLGWLQSWEALTLRWCDIATIEPHRSAQADLPTATGLLKLCLSPETKSNRTTRADVIISYYTLSGYCIGKWFHRSRHLNNAVGNWIDDTRSIFRHPNGTVWTSKNFRQEYLYPSLQQQATIGDPYLQAFRDDLEIKIWSIHCYGRGARSHVSKGGIFGKYRFTKATNDQVYEHARWSRRRSSEAIDKQYLEWTPRERIFITLYCH